MAKNVLVLCLILLRMQVTQNLFNGDAFNFICGDVSAYCVMFCVVLKKANEMWMKNSLKPSHDVNEDALKRTTKL